MGLRDILTTRVLESGDRLHVRSALNPMLWLCAIVTVPGLVVMTVIGSAPTWLVGLLCAPVAAAIAGFGFLLVFDRSRLQSEDYQLREMALEMIEEKGDSGAISAAVVEVIARPEPNYLPASDRVDSND